MLTEIAPGRISEQIEVRKNKKRRKPRIVA
jgi:hypothetical protein